MTESIDEITRRTVERLELAAEQAPRCGDPEAEQKPDPGVKELIRCGFPLRHVERLSDGLHGPGLAMMLRHRDKIVKGDALLVLIGDRGPGKTQIATAWASERHQAGKAVGRYIKCADLISEIKATWSDGGKFVGTEHDVLVKYRRTGYLTIDEFHEKGASDWEARTLINLIDHRYDDMKATVLIANVKAGEETSIVNSSIIDRANQTGGVIVCDWPSYRL